MNSRREVRESWVWFIGNIFLTLPAGCQFRKSSPSGTEWALSRNDAVEVEDGGARSSRPLSSASRRRAGCSRPGALNGERDLPHQLLGETPNRATGTVALLFSDCIPPASGGPDRLKPALQPGGESEAPTRSRPCL